MSSPSGRSLALALVAGAILGCRPGAAAPRGASPEAAPPVGAGPGALDADGRRGEAEAAPAPVRRLAVTVDDLPAAFFDSFANDGERLAMVREWVALLGERRIPVTGFVIGRNARRQPALLGLWTEADVALGNHTDSHPRLRKVGLGAYLADLERGHREVASHLPAGATIPFRYPYLYEGFDPAERDAIRARLAELGSPIAPITVETNDWLYAQEHAAALGRGDREGAERCARAWRWDAEDATIEAEWRSRELFGREPPQVLLVHANRLTARLLPGYLDWLEGRGYSFVALAEALADPAYAEPDRSLVLTGDSHWLRLWRTRHPGGARAGDG